jgi:DNA polymerase III sliding clamp (beta) subunit (PCNA family)
MAMKTTVDANLFRLVNTTIGKDETRYYINGVSIEPHPEAGAIMVATDGHRMLVAYDENGICEEKIIVKLPKYALAECKAKLGTSKLLEIDHDVAGSAKVINVTGKNDDKKFEDVLIAYNVLIDGTFPDWRRVVPDLASDEAPATAVGFNTKYLKEFGALGLEISNTIDGAGPAFVLHKPSATSPTIIRWSGARNIFGVFMPMRFDDRGPAIPSFIRLPAPQAAE